LSFDQEKLQSRMRTIKTKVEENSAVIDQIVDSLVRKYSRDLDDYVTKVKALLDKYEELSDQEIEDIVLRIPVFMYFSVTGLEALGIEGDNARIVKMEAFNRAFLEAEGTIQDKKNTAEQQTYAEHLVEIAFDRAYKKLKKQIDMAEHIFSGAKKVLSKRMLEIELSKGDTGKISKRIMEED
jgi:hypothetical protein